MSWLGGTSMRSRLSRTFVGLGLISVVLLAGVNLVVVRQLVNDNVEEQLVTVRRLRQTSINRGFENILDQTSALAADPGVVEAFAALRADYRSIDTGIDDPQRSELEDVYRSEVIGPLDAAGVEPPAIDDMVPESDGGLYLQYHYIAANPNGTADRAELADAGDGSAYSESHARYHEFLRALAANAGVRDLMFIDGSTGEVVYSVNKLVDFGADSDAESYAGSGLGAVLDQLATVGVGDAVVADSAFYLPDLSAPVLHVAASVRYQSEVLGSVVVGLSIDRLTSLLNADGRWQLLGLGDTGDAYVVGPDFTLRSEPRSWIEDPDGYLERIDDIGVDARTVGLIEFTGSPVLFQRVDNKAVDAALDGEEYLGVVSNHEDRRALTSAGKADVAGLNWVVVAEQRVNESRSVLVDFIWTVLLELAILLPVLAVIGLVLARRLARPIGPLVASAERIAGGDFDTDVPDLGRNELGDLATQLDQVATQLADQERAIESEEARIETMLGSMVPPSMIERIRAGERDLTNERGVGTVVAISVGGIPDPSGAEQDAVIELTSALTARSRTLADDRGLERIRVANDQLLFLAGRASEGTDVDVAAEFSVELAELVAGLGAEFGVDLTTRTGLSAGEVGSGIVGTHQLSFGVWGDSIGRAVVLSTVARPGECLMDGPTADDLGDGWATERADDRDVGIDDVYSLVLQDEQANLSD